MKPMPSSLELEEDCSPQGRFSQHQISVSYEWNDLLDTFTAELCIAEYPHHIRNLLTQTVTHEEIRIYSGAKVESQGDGLHKNPLRLVIKSNKRSNIERAVTWIKRLIDQAMNLPKYKEKVLIGLENAASSFDVRGKVVGPNGANLQYITNETGAIVTLRGRGSGFIEPTTGLESIEPLHLCVEHNSKYEVLQAGRQLAFNLIETVQQEWFTYQQQMQQNSNQQGSNQQSSNQQGSGQQNTVQQGSVQQPVTQHISTSQHHPGGVSISSAGLVPHSTPLQLPTNLNELVQGPPPQLPGQLPSLPAQLIHPGQLVTGQPAGQLVPGQSSGQLVSGQSQGQLVPGQAPGQILPGQSNQLVPGQPPGQMVGNQPQGQLVPGQSAAQLVAGQPPGQLVPGHPPGQLLPGQPPNQLVAGQSPSQLVQSHLQGQIQAQLLQSGQFHPGQIIDQLPLLHHQQPIGHMVVPGSGGSVQVVPGTSPSVQLVQHPQHTTLQEFSHVYTATSGSSGNTSMLTQQVVAGQTGNQASAHQVLAQQSNALTQQVLQPGILQHPHIISQPSYPIQYMQGGGVQLVYGGTNASRDVMLVQYGTQARSRVQPQLVQLVHPGTGQVMGTAPLLLQAGGQPLVVQQSGGGGGGQPLVVQQSGGQPLVVQQSGGQNLIVPQHQIQFAQPTLQILPPHHQGSLVSSSGLPGRQNVHKRRFEPDSQQVVYQSRSEGSSPHHTSKGIGEEGTPSKVARAGPTSSPSTNSKLPVASTQSDEADTAQSQTRDVKNEGVKRGRLSSQSGEDNEASKESKQSVVSYSYGTAKQEYQHLPMTNQHSMQTPAGQHMQQNQHTMQTSAGQHIQQMSQQNQQSLQAPQGMQLPPPAAPPQFTTAPPPHFTAPPPQGVPPSAQFTAPPPHYPPHYYQQPPYQHYQPSWNHIQPGNQ